MTHCKHEWFCNSLTVGPLEVNCYIVGREKDPWCLVIDPGWEWDRIQEFLSKIGKTIGGVLLTHGHFDHFSGLSGLKDKVTFSVFLHPADHRLYGNSWNVLPGFPIPTNLPPLLDEPLLEWLTIGGLKVLHTPGHSPGSCAFYFSEWNLLFSGDTLFAGSVGRTDLFGGNWEDLLRSIHEKLLILPDEVLVYPGHGPASSVGEEKRYNPFLR